MTKHNIVVLLILIGYYILTAISGILISTKTKLPNEIKRKILHSIGFISYGFFVYGFDNYIFSIIVSLLIGIGSFILILILERYKPEYIEFFKERHKGEIKYTILLVYITFSFTLLISWGYLDIKELGLLVIYTWGFSDVAASLIGKAYGIHHLRINKSKTLEGSAACFTISVITSLIITLFYFPFSLEIFIFIFLIGLISSFTEAISKYGLDTVLVPFSLLLFSSLIYILYAR